MNRRRSRRFSPVVLLIAVLAVWFSCTFDRPLTVVCGNGLICPAGTTCTADRQMCIQGTCGDGVLDPDETCDDGNVVDGDECASNCRDNTNCGNGLLDPGEICDDGSNQSGDGCSADCLSDESCGNGYIDTIKGEACDDGNNEGGDGCSADCMSDESCDNGPAWLRVCGSDADWLLAW